MRMLDIPFAGLMPEASGFATRFLGRLSGSLHGRLNRKVVARLDGFTDHELADIGLTRRDVKSALDGAGFFGDPSRQLARVARAKRPG